MKLNIEKLNNELYTNFKFDINKYKLSETIHIESNNSFKTLQNGGLLERKGAPFTTLKQDKPEFPYNGKSMYKGGYNIKRALELYKPDNTGHLPSVDSKTGEWLKDKDYPTSQEELMQTTLNLNLHKKVKSWVFFFYKF